jgi:hypothetical protein
MKTNYIYAAALALVLGTTYAVAAPGDGACQQHPDAPFCQGEGEPTGGAGNEQGQEQLQGQGQLQAQGQAQGQGQDQSQTAVGVGVGIGEGGDAYAQGGSSRNTNLVGQDVDVENTNVNLNGAVATGGQGGEGGDGGSARSSSGSSAYSDGSNSSSGGNSQGTEVFVDNTDNSSYSKIEEYPVSTAAGIYAGVCQTGMSGQTDNVGVNVLNTDALCEVLKVAEMNYIAAGREYKEPVCTEYTKVLPIEDKGKGYEIVTEERVYENCEAQVQTEAFDGFMAEYYDGLDEANYMMAVTEDVGVIDKFFGYLVRPLGLIGLLIFLI